MNTTIKTNKVKARKDHKCGYCNGRIEKGDVHNTDICAGDTIFTFRSHIHCSNLVSEMIDWNDFQDGLNSDSFMEEIRCQYQIHTGLNTIGVPFGEMLKYMLNKYEINKI